MLTSSRFPIARQTLTLTVATLALLVLPGCNYFIALGYLIGGPPQIEPLFEKETQKSFTDRDVQVAVVCYAPDDLKKTDDNIDQMLSQRLAALLRMNEIKVVDPAEVNAWMVKNPDWDSATEIGAEFDVNYVVYVDMSTFSLFEHDSTSLLRGRCDTIVSVYEMETDGDGRRIWNKDVSSVFPKMMPRSLSDVSYDEFRNLYFFRLADDVGRMFYPHRNGDDIPNAT